MQNNNLILPVDQELLNKMQKIDPVVNHHEFNSLRQITILQTEATLRNRKTMVDLDKSNKRFSLTIMGLTFIQITLAMFDSIFQITTYEDKAKGYIYLAIFFITMFYIVWMIYKDLKNNAN